MLTGVTFDMTLNTLLPLFHKDPGFPFVFFTIDLIYPNLDPHITSKTSSSL